VEAEILVQLFVVYCSLVVKLETKCWCITCHTEVQLSFDTA